MSQPNGYRLDAEQRARVRDCLRKEQIELPPDQFERFARSLEASIECFNATPPEGTFREMHNTLRELWHLAHDDDPPIGQLRARLRSLPAKTREFIGRRAPIVIPKLFRGERIGDGTFVMPECAYGWFFDWAMAAEGPKLVTVVRVLAANGAVKVAGRSRGDGKRSRARIEPDIAGTVRGGSGPKDQGGRPGETARQDLVMHLALDWLHATGSMPKPGRSDATGFGELVHSVFQWLDLSENPSEAAAQTLRRYWTAVRKGRFDNWTARC